MPNFDFYVNLCQICDIIFGSDDKKLFLRTLNNMIRNYYKFRDNVKIISKHYSFLIKVIKDSGYVGIVNEWLVDNYFSIIEKKNNLEEFFSTRENRSNMKKYGDKLFKMMQQIFKQYDYKIEYKPLIRNILKYQQRFAKPLCYEEFSLIAPIMTIITVEKIANLCRRQNIKLQERLQATNDVRSLNEAEISSSQLSDFISLSAVATRPDYIENLYYELNKTGVSSKRIFEEINRVLQVNKTPLKSVINNVHNDRVKEHLLVVNLFNILKLINKLKMETLIKDASLTEKVLCKDADYAGMSVSTKQTYRLKIIKLAKKKKTSQHQLAIDLTQRGKQEKTHIGFYLFKTPNYKSRSRVYVSVVTSLTVLLSFAVAFLFSKYVPVMFLLLLIPMSELVQQIMNKIMSRIYRPQPLPKMDFSKGIPNKCKTMVVVPTIVKDTKKIDAMYEQLEKYYLANKTENLYFSLLGDACESSTLELDVDKSICEYGLQKCEQLNKKYGKELFYFVFRKRVFHKSENAFLGYERKRGGLLHFNKLLLRKMSEKEKKIFINAENLHSLRAQIKYVITLDADTQLIIDSASKIVSTMAHPLNAPVVDEQKNIVTKGYAIMQPKISVDIESSNKSTYVQLFGGLGGFDTYNPILSNFYQDVFAEGSFMGKGIYDLKVFQKVLEGRFPLSLILSHDLLEGNYLRSGFISDVEIVDNFPSKFLTDMSRHHRWARGDTQISPWLFGSVKTENGEREKNPVSTIGKFKIFDNIRRMFLDFSLFAILVYALFEGQKYSWLWLGFILLVIMLPVFFYLNEKLKYRFTKEKKHKLKPYKSLILGFRAIILGSLVTFITIPYKMNMYANAFFKALFRMKISKKRLLNWLTAEEAEKVVKNNLQTYIKNFLPNILVAVVLSALVAVFNKDMLLVSTIINAMFLSAPFVMFAISQDQKSSLEDLNGKEIDELKQLAQRTWRFFEDHLNDKFKFLVPDNYQNNREYKSDIKTSATDIGFSLIAIISAYKFNFIDRKKAIYYLKGVMNTVDKLAKWNGHLYNWYNVKTLEAMYPQFVSTVDSGNFVASLIVLKEFLKEENEHEFADQIASMIVNTDFSRLYTKSHVFSVGYNTMEGDKSVYNYNNFASESRLTSFVAIAKGDVPVKHWFSLDKTLTKFKNRKGLASWAGSMFEYYMPVIFMKTYENTLIDESCDFAVFVQKKYMEEIDKNMPWGISECAYDELDDGINYKYKSFSVSYLRMQEDINPRIVVSPYSSLMSLKDNPKAVYNNLRKFKSMGMLGKYGYYESFDTTTSRPIFAFFAHHQGMVLATLSNYLCDGLIQNYFSANPHVQAYEILAKEKIQMRPAIDIKIEKFKKFNYRKEEMENDIRAFSKLGDTREVAVLSNNQYSVVLNDKGQNFSKFKNVQLNRYRETDTSDQGTFLFIKDTKTGKVWSNTFAPVNKEPEKYEVVFASDKIKYVLTENDVITTTEIAVTKTHPAEIRKITLKNNSKKDKMLELTSFMEPIITMNQNDITHRTYHGLFVTSEYDSSVNALIMKRDLKDNPSNYYLLHKLFSTKFSSSDAEYETSRSKFFGSSKSLQQPEALSGRLSSSGSTPIDAVMSMRNKIILPKGASETIYLINAFGTSKEQVVDIANAYNTHVKIEKAFEVSSISNMINNKLLNLSGMQMRVFNSMLNIIFRKGEEIKSPHFVEMLSKNKLFQDTLWKYGISGDRPIMCVNLKDIGAFGVVKEMLKAFEYFKSKNIYLDIVIINDETPKYTNFIKKEVDLEVYRINSASSFASSPGEVHLLNGSVISSEEKALMSLVSKISIDAVKNISLEESVEQLIDRMVAKSVYAPIVVQKNVKIDYNVAKLEKYNGYGGFLNSGKEYVILKDTPTPWINVLSNAHFGSIVTSRGGGFTYAYNSQEYKLSAWTNDILDHAPSEKLFVNNEMFLPSVTTHGFGYSNFVSKTKDFEQSQTQFVAKSDSAKIYSFSIKNTSTSTKNVKLCYALDAVLGSAADNSARFLYASWDKEQNMMTIKNVYNKNYADKLVFVSSSEPIVSVETDNLISKSVKVALTLSPEEERQVCFVLGSGKTSAEVATLVKKYSSVESCKKELESVKAHWQTTLGVVQVHTPDNSLNYVLNGWYLYQAIASRILARAGFYQVSGAYGFRDQLQDSVNICSLFPEVTKNQILINARHQFEKGDVLHWWLSSSRFGLRSRYKDDALWLIYAVSEYVNKTGDFTILDEQLPFIKGEALGSREDSRGMVYHYTNYTKPLFEHILIIMENAINDFGVHGLPKMGGGDWNDGMNKIGIRGTGESVWLGFFLYDMLGRFVSLTKVHNKNLDCQKFVDKRNELYYSLNKDGWDETYYLRAFFDNGAKVGSVESEECKIDLISQSFAVLTDVANADRTESVMNAVEKHLVDLDNKIVKLLTPPFKYSSDYPGYIMDYPKGIRENGGQYTHAVAWYVQALLKAGRGEFAYRIYQMINPINRTLIKESVNVYKTEPYVIAADIYSNEGNEGRGGWTWYTGSAAWFFKVGMEDILGIKKQGNILLVEPKVREWKSFSFYYMFKRTKYSIQVLFAKKSKIVQDGKPIKNIKLVDDRKRKQITVYVGE